MRDAKLDHSGIPERHQSLWARAFDSLAGIRHLFARTRDLADATWDDIRYLPYWFDALEHVVRRLIIAAALNFVVPRELLLPARCPRDDDDTPEPAKALKESAEPPRLPFIVMSGGPASSANVDAPGAGRPAPSRMQRPLLPPTAPQLAARLDVLMHAMNNAGAFAQRLAVRLARKTSGAPIIVQAWMRRQSRLRRPALLRDLVTSVLPLVPHELAAFMARDPRPG